MRATPPEDHTPAFLKLGGEVQFRHEFRHHVQFIIEEIVQSFRRPIRGSILKPLIEIANDDFPDSSPQRIEVLACRSAGPAESPGCTSGTVQASRSPVMPDFRSVPHRGGDCHFPRCARAEIRSPGISRKPMSAVKRCRGKGVSLKALSSRLRIKQFAKQVIRTRPVERVGTQPDPHPRLRHSSAISPRSCTTTNR